MSEATQARILSGYLRQKRDRIFSELKRGHVVVVRDRKGQAGLIRAAEFADYDGEFNSYSSVSAPIMCITARHVQSLGRDVATGVRCFSLPARNLTAEQQLALALGHPESGAEESLKSIQILAESEDSLPDLSCRLLKAAKLLPAALLVRLSNPSEKELARLSQTYNLTIVEAREVRDITGFAEPELIPSGRAHLPLAAAPDSEIVMFREPGGTEEHFAVIVGEQEDGVQPLVRLHSQCVTGDILGSLKCDCGDQLTSALAKMHESGFGILLYLQQEGRDIGLLNKIRAYALQDDGFDTVDANHRLGFETDERVFAPAAVMLKALGYTDIRLLTNNPEKLEQLGKFGITISERVPLAIQPNKHNQHYLKTKKNRTGHLLDD